MAGVLYIVATPIGNLEDLTLRAIRILGEVDLIAAEDTRVSRKLLNHLDLHQPLVSYYQQNQQARGAYLLRELQAGKQIALLSDAGTPLLSDPGAELVQLAVAAGIAVVPVPGASALLTALMAAGLSAERFCFEGFLPREKGKRRAALADLAGESRTLVFYEAPHRLRELLADLALVFGAERPCAIGRELTKRYEQFLRGSLAEIQAHFQTTAPQGEFVLVVAGKVAEAVEIPADEVLLQELEALLAQGLSRKTAAKAVAERYALPVKTIYALGLK